MASDSFQYRALFEYRPERGDDIGLQPGDLLTVAKAWMVAAPGRDHQDGDERSPRGWLHGTNERTKETGDFPGTFVEYVGAVRLGPPPAKAWPRPVPPTPGGPQASVGVQPPGAAAALGECQLMCVWVVSSDTDFSLAEESFSSLKSLWLFVRLAGLLTVPLGPRLGRLRQRPPHILRKPSHCPVLVCCYFILIRQFQRFSRKMNVEGP